MLNEMKNGKAPGPRYVSLGYSRESKNSSDG